MSTKKEQADFEKEFDKAYEEKSPNFDQHVNIAMVGKVSAGKSSLLNAIFKCPREEPLAKVGAKSGITTGITPYKLDEHVLIVDCPGLDDVRKENSVETKKFLSSIDLGIFVVTGSADSAQKANFDDLRKNCGKTLVVLNKIDEWDDLEESEYAAVVQQWKEALGSDGVFGTCTKGYDPKMRKSAPMDIRGVDELRDTIFEFLKEERKDILLAKHLKSKSDYAVKIISAAVIAAAGEAFIPGSAAYITATQGAAIVSLNYLYKGETLSKSAVLSLLPTFAGESIGTTAFLWAKSFLPPTGVLDLAAAIIAATVTFAMLATVKWMLENEHSLSERDELKSAFKFFRSLDGFGKVSLSDLRSIEHIVTIVRKLLAVPTKGLI